MTAIAAGRIERSTVPLRTSTGHAAIRTATDKYWSLLFVVFFIILAAAGRNVVRHKSDCQINSDNCIATNNISDLFNNMPDSYETFINITVEHISHIWGKNWLFDAITCNVAFLDTHYENSGVIVILAYLLVCGILIVYAFASMCTDDLYCRQMHVFSLFLLFCTFFTRIPNFSEKNVTTYFFIRCFSLPEVILFIVVCSKLSILDKYLKSLTSYDPEPHISIMCFLMPPLLWVNIINFFVVSLWLLIKGVLKNYELILNNDLSSYIFIGAMLYMCLIYYYFLLMASSCATSLSFGSEFPDFENFLYALFVVARYHFGTVCYHATLILPGIHTTFVMNEKEFKGIPNFPTIYRFYLTHWTLRNLSTMVTAARGYEHAASTREMLRLFASDSPKLKNFQTYKKMFRSLSALLIAINSLMFISFWVHGVPIDRRSVMGVWVASLIGMFIANLIAELFDAVADVLWFHNDGTIAIKA